MLAVAPFLAPLAQRQHDRQQAFALGGQRIDDARAVGRDRARARGSRRRPSCQPVGEDVAGNAEPGLEFLEMLEAVERAAKDQERPFLADQLDRGGKRARQSRFPERVDAATSACQPASPFSPLPNLIKAQNGSKKQLRSETEHDNQFQFATITGGIAMLRFVLVLSAACALLPRPPLAATYSAKLAAPATERIIARDINWACGADACQGATDESRPAVLCQSLAKRAGRVDSFLVDGRAFAAAELDKCNAVGQGCAEPGARRPISFPRGRAVPLPPARPPLFRACTRAPPPPS